MTVTATRPSPASGGAEAGPASRFAPVAAPVADPDRGSRRLARSDRRRLSGTPASVAVVLVAAMTLIAGCEWHRVFGWAPIRWRILPVAVVPALLAWLVDRTFRRFDGFADQGSPLTVALPISLIALGLWLLPGGLLGSLSDGLINGWAKLLGQPLPAPPAPNLLVLPAITLWVASFIGTEVVLRVTRPVLAGLAPAGAYGLAMAFGIGGPGSRLWPSALMLTAGLGLAGVVTWAGRAGPGAAPLMSGRRLGALAVPGRRLAEIAGCAVVAAILAAWIGPSLPGIRSHRPYDPHTGQVPLTQPTAEVNPLANLSAWAETPDPVLFHLRVSRPADLRLAVLDTYDPGIGWTVGPANRFQATGKDVAGDVSRHGRVTVSQQVIVGDITGRWLPSADRPVKVTGVSAVVEPHTGVLLARNPLPAGSGYQVRSIAAAGAPTCRLSGAVSPSGSRSEIPTPLVNLAATMTASATSPCARAQALATGLRDAYKFDAKAPSGSNIQILSNFLVGSADNKGGQGTSEQFASSFALLGRALSLSTRVVVGFRSASTGELRAGDAQAWPEVNFTGVGWVAFDPTPAANQSSHPDKPIEGSTSGSQAKVNPAGNGPQPVEAAPRLPRLRSHHHRGPWGTVGLVAGIVAGAALLILLGLVILVAALRRRRRSARRRAADNRARVVGAWKESLDSLSEAGVASAPAFTASQVVAAGAGRLGEGPARDLADLGGLVNSAVYGPAVPDEEAVAQAWADADRLASAARSGLTAGDRLRRALDVSVLIRSR